MIFTEYDITSVTGMCRKLTLIVMLCNVFKQQLHKTLISEEAVSRASSYKYPKVKNFKTVQRSLHCISEGLLSWNKMGRENIARHMFDAAKPESFNSR